MKIGDKFRQRIDEAIRVHDKLLLVLTASGEWRVTRSEWREAGSEEKGKKRAPHCSLLRRASSG